MFRVNLLVFFEKLDWFLYRILLLFLIVLDIAYLFGTTLLESIRIYLGRKSKVFSYLIQVYLISSINNNYASCHFFSFLLFLFMNIFCRLTQSTWLASDCVCTSDHPMYDGHLLFDFFSNDKNSFGNYPVCLGIVTTVN